MSKIKDIGWTALGCLIPIGLIIAVIFLIHFGSSVAGSAIHALSLASGWVTIIDLLIVLPLLMFRRTRGLASTVLFLTSYLFGLTTWVYGFLVTYSFWGIIGVLLGVFVFGVGVVPFGVIAAALNGQWWVVGGLLYGVFITFGSRTLALYIAEKVDNQVEIIPEPVLQIQGTHCGQCGAEATDDALFCTSCGVTLKEDNNKK